MSVPEPLTTLLSQLHDPAVRDLAWVIGSPGLLDSSHPAYQGKVVTDTWCARALDYCHDWLLQLDAQPAPLQQFITQHATRRLGYYFETLIEFWLAHVSGIQLIAHNLPVRENSITLGEFDFLFNDQSARTIHWETAIKLYLQAEDTQAQHDFIGPGGYDRLDLKTTRIFEHQLKLAHSPACQVDVYANMAFIKGMLFYHSSGKHSAPPAGISTSHLRGWWIRHQQDDIPRTSAHSCWLILPRLSWLAPARLSEQAETMSWSELQNRINENFEKRKNALLVAELVQDSTGYWQEVSRGFIVTPDWPLIPSST